MNTFIDIIQITLLIFSVFVFLCGIFKPSILLRKKFIGRRFLLILAPLWAILGVWFLQDYRINHVFTDEKRIEYYADLEESRRRDSIEVEVEKHKLFIQDSISKKKTKEIRSAFMIANSRLDSIKKIHALIQEENEAKLKTYPCVVENVKYTNKRITGIGLTALKQVDSRYVVVTFSIKNNFKNAVQLEQDSFKIFDGENYYDVSINAQIEAEFTTNLFATYAFFDIIEKINPKMKKDFKLIYEVPKFGKYRLLCTDNRVYLHD